jgi:hypothetical protein
VIPCGEFVAYFHSDGSVEDWGYKFTATPTYPARASAATRTHWLVKLEFELTQATSSLAAAMVTGLPWQPELEGPHQAWMANPLIR